MKADKKSQGVGTPSRNELLKSLNLLRPEIFQSLRLHGNTKWLPHVLVGAALAWVWSLEPTLGGRYDAGLSTLAGWFPAAFTATSYQGFIKALMTWSPCLVEILQGVLQKRMKALPNHWQVGKWTCFAVDGSKIELPWTKAHEAEFGMGAVKRKRRSRKRVDSANSQTHQEMRPQAYLTLAWHVDTGLPWAWRIGPVSASERDALREMLHLFPEDALLAVDAGFTGYDLSRQILDGGRHFVMRVGSNVQLLKNLGYGVRTNSDTVCLWPDAMRKQQQPPLVLRLITFRTATTTAHLLTDLTPAQLSDKNAVELYKKRWGIECFFRGFKQTFQRRKLLSAAPAQARCELEWSLIGLWLICLVAAEELTRSGKSPRQISVAKVIRAIRGVCGRSNMARGEWRRLLRAAVKDTYKRCSSKAGRHAHRKKRHIPCGTPNILSATAEQRRDARQLPAPQRVA